MLFNSLEYLLFLPLVVLLYHRLQHRLQNALLLFASYLFYTFWDWRFLGLILLSTLVDYCCGLFVNAAPTARRKRGWLLLSVVANLTILGLFKYYGFFVVNAALLLERVGLNPGTPVLHILLPVGISFYTFQSMAYTIEIYRGRMNPVKNLLDFSLYVCYFPQLVAGPIERPRRLLPALQRERHVSSRMVMTGSTLILIGLFRKVGIADGVAAQIDPIFRSSQNFTTPELLKGAYLFAIQIYCDFAGYSDIARGSSRLFGIELMRNFRQPLLSRNVTEFWQRWHISLSTWFRDYLYAPLGGSRKGSLRTGFNLVVTMALVGLWHGAAWSYLVWGGVNGVYLAVHRFWSRHRLGRRRKSSVGKWRNGVAVFLTFHLFVLTAILFRAPGLRAGLLYYQNLLQFRGMETWVAAAAAVAVPLLLMVILDVAQSQARSETFLLGLRRPLQSVAVAAMIFMILLGIGARVPFLYFQF